MSQNTQNLDMAVMAKFMENFIGFDGNQEEFCKQMEDFREAIIEIARDTQKIPEPGIESFVDSQILVSNLHTTSRLQIAYENRLFGTSLNACKNFLADTHPQSLTKKNNWK